MTRLPVNSKQSRFVGEETSARFKQQRLLEDYLEVQKEFVSRKKLLQTTKQKREILLAEVSFLRRRHKHLRMQSQELEAKQGLVGRQDSPAERKLLVKNGDSGGDEEWDRNTKEEVVLEPLKVGKKRKNQAITEEKVGKKKISWRDQEAALKL